VIKIEAFKYQAEEVPQGYECGKCGAKGCRLWRRYQTFLNHQDLFCANCAEKDQKEKLKLEGISAIGWLCAAVPTEEGDTFWGYTSIPDAGCEWWYDLPIRPGEKRPEDALDPYMKRRFQSLREHKQFLKEIIAEFAAHARSRMAQGLPPEERQIERLERFSK